MKTKLPKQSQIYNHDTRKSKAPHLPPYKCYQVPGISEQQSALVKNNTWLLELNFRHPNSFVPEVFLSIYWYYGKSRNKHKGADLNIVKTTQQQTQLFFCLQAFKTTSVK